MYYVNKTTDCHLSFRNSLYACVTMGLKGFKMEKNSLNRFHTVTGNYQQELLK